MGIGLKDNALGRFFEREEKAAFVEVCGMPMAVYEERVSSILELCVRFWIVSVRSFIRDSNASPAGPAHFLAIS